MWTSLVCQHEEGFASKAGAAKKYADLRKRESRPVEGDPRGVTDDHEPTIPVPAGAMRWQTTRFCVQRQKVIPKRAVLRQVLAPDEAWNVLATDCANGVDLLITAKKAPTNNATIAPMRAM